MTSLRTTNGEESEGWPKLLRNLCSSSLTSGSDFGSEPHSYFEGCQILRHPLLQTGVSHVMRSIPDLSLNNDSKVYKSIPQTIHGHLFFGLTKSSKAGERKSLRSAIVSQ